MGVTKAVIERDAGADHCARDLRLEMFARNDDDDARNATVGKHRMREPCRETRFSGAWCCDDERVGGALAVPRFERLVLPGA